MTNEVSSRVWCGQECNPAGVAPLREDCQSIGRIEFQRRFPKFAQLARLPYRRLRRYVNRAQSSTHGNNRFRQPGIDVQPGADTLTVAPIHAAKVERREDIAAESAHYLRT